MKKLYTFFKKAFNPQSGTYSFLLGLMSFLAILISLLTLQEMKTQRELSMMPIIRIQNLDNVSLEVDSSCAEAFFTKGIRIRARDQKEEALLLSTDPLKLRLVNVGEGSAVNIEIDWELDFAWFASHFDSLKIDPLKFKFNLTEENILYTYQKCDGGINGISYGLDITDKRSHLLPASSQPEGTMLQIPSIVIELLVNAIRAKWMIEGQSGENLLEGKDLETSLNIRYESVTGELYKEQYKVSFILIPSFISTQSLSGDIKKVSASDQRFILELKIEKV